VEHRYYIGMWSSQHRYRPREAQRVPGS
jgi:hypothetical protein